MNRRLLLRAGTDSQHGRLRRLADTLRLDDPTEEIAAAWAVKELLRQLLAARDRHTIAHRLHRFYEAVTLVDLPEATRLAKPSTPGGPRSSASSKPGSPTAEPKVRIGLSKTPPGSLSA